MSNDNVGGLSIHNQGVLYADFLDIFEVQIINMTLK